MEKVTVIINNRDLLEWPKKMCHDIERMIGLYEIIILDNGSTNKKLLQWYKDCNYKVFFLENIGHTAPWVCGILDKLETDLYIVSDPDLDLSGLPNDTLLQLQKILVNNPNLTKVGVLLETKDIPPESPYYNHVREYESIQMTDAAPDLEWVNAPVDTTFALYDRRIVSHYTISGVRATRPYVAKHLPWYVIKPEGEFLEYLQKANSSSSYKLFTNFNELSSLRQLYDSTKTGKISTKWSSYFPIYDKWLSSLKNEHITLLEIGVQNGGSLEIWSKYFLNGFLFLGCDINPAITSLVYDDPRIKLSVGAASSTDVFERNLNIANGKFDVIIDDGSHQSSDTINNFINYFNYLSPGGIYIVEDMHCAYWSEYGGGYFNDRSASSFFRRLFDLVNIEHARGDISAEKLFHTFFDQQEVPSFLKNGSVFSITSYNSIYIIQKSSNSLMPLLGEVVYAGDDASIEPRVLPGR